MVRQAGDDGGPRGECADAHAGVGDDEGEGEGDVEGDGGYEGVGEGGYEGEGEVPQRRTLAAAAARPSLPPGSCARPRCRTPPRGTPRGRRAPRRRPALSKDDCRGFSVRGHPYMTSALRGGGGLAQKKM